MKQTTLAIEIDHTSAPQMTLPPEQRRRLLELMAAAIVAVHRATEDASAEDVDDNACE